MRLVSQEDFDRAKSRDSVYLYCDCCDIIFPSPKHDIMSKRKRGVRNKYCSKECAYASRRGAIKPCLQCGKDTKSRFCSRSCAGTFNSTGRYRLPRIACTTCGKETTNSKFCSLRCQAKFEREEYLSRWRSGLETGIKGTRGQVSKCVRDYLLRKYENKCARCGWCEINPTTGKVPVQIEHIDGNFWNCKEDNLIILCPNCHSLTSTYMGLNKGKGRGTFGLRKG